MRCFTNPDLKGQGAQECQAEKNGDVNRHGKVRFWLGLKWTRNYNIYSSETLVDLFKVLNMILKR